MQSPPEIRSFERPLGLVMVDRHATYRKNLRMFIEKDPQLTVLAEAENGLQAIQAVEVHRPDVVLMDVSLDENREVMGGLEATQIITSRFPEVRVIALSMYDDAHVGAIACKAGACQFLLKESSLIQIVAAIKDGHGDSGRL